MAMNIDAIGTWINVHPLTFWFTCCGGLNYTIAWIVRLLNKNGRDWDEWLLSLLMVVLGPIGTLIFIIFGLVISIRKISESDVKFPRWL